MKILLILLSFMWTVSFYNLQFNDVDGNVQSMDQYRTAGKKILFVNLASNSTRINQITGLKQLQQQYANKLIIIGFPSNSFGHEPLHNDSIKIFYQNLYQINFALSTKASVTGSDAHPVYQWLQNKSENNILDQPVGGDFQKYLVNEEGMLIAVFSPAVEPLDEKITDAILQ